MKKIKHFLSSSFALRETAVPREGLSSKGLYGSVQGGPASRCLLEVIKVRFGCHPPDFRALNDLLLFREVNQSIMNSSPFQVRTEPFGSLWTPNVVP